MNARDLPISSSAHVDYDALSAAEKRRFGMYLEQGTHIY